jgi:outer membrane protein OmpA-like peptidoglycan-associated protein
MARLAANPQVHGNSLIQLPVISYQLSMLPSQYRVILVIVALTVHCLLITDNCHAQDPKSLDLYNQGIKLFGERKANEAIPFMQEAIKRNPNFLDAYVKLGQLYEFTRKPEPALTAYREAIRIQPDPATNGTAFQGAANLLLRLGRYADALPVLERYQPVFAPQSAQHKRVARQLETARFGQQAVANPQPVSPRPVSAGLNTTPSQYFPVLTADEQTLLFTALKPEGDEDLMVASFNGEVWSAPVSLSPDINTPENEGTASLAADGRTVVFTACQNRRGFGGCDLYQSRKTGDVWSSPTNLGPNINTGNYESQPSLSADGRRLYFVSDRPGGQGRRDIWRSNRDADGNWQTPVNLGQPVNTAFNEASPFIHANGQSLFFASEGHIGLGGYDLFVTDSLATMGGTGTSNFLPKSAWSVPQNLGYPINTSEDQASLFVSANGIRAYYSFEEQKDGVSQRSRLYVFDLPESLRERVKPVSYLKGVVLDGKTKKPMTAQIDIIDLKTNQLVSQIQADSETGQYVAVLPGEGQYALYVSGPNYLFKSLSFDFTGKTDSGAARLLDVLLEPVGATNHETLNNLFFESGRYDLADKSRTELDRLATFMKANPAVRIEIGGHTDDLGDATTNLTLSKKRAQGVVDYLTKAGIDPARVRAVGYGKTRPLLPNTSDENRRQNRRIEWKVL